MTWTVTWYSPGVLNCAVVVGPGGAVASAVEVPSVGEAGVARGSRTVALNETLPPTWIVVLRGRALTVIGWPFEHVDAEARAGYGD